MVYQIFFWAGRGPSINIPLITTITDNTYHDFRLEYTHNNTTYELFINNISQGTLQATVQTFSVINDIFFYPYTNTHVKNVYVYEGAP